MFWVRVFALSVPGYHGRYLRIDAQSACAECVPLRSATLQRWIGGVGLGVRLLMLENRPGIDPLAPDSALIVALSPLVGSPLTTSAKFAVVGKSPLTQRVCDALSSSHFALAAKRAGVDALVIRGAWTRPVVLLIDGQDRDVPLVTLRDARDLWGLPAAETETRLRATLGPEWHIAAIGPAGEALIPFATISHDGRHAGRGGLGAVLGSKRVKALAVRGNRRTALADPAQVVRLARDLSARSFGPATEKYRELGTVANLLVFNRLDALPTRNFASGQFEAAEALAAVDLAPARRLARKSCAACTIGCEHLYPSRDGSAVRLEYESLFALGPLCGVSDPTVVLEAAALCDRLGLDTISTGGTIAFAMEAARRGWLDPGLPSGRRLVFGDGAALLEAIGLIVTRNALGALLSLGCRRLAETLGGAAPDHAMHVKGLELPGYDPRALHAMALGLAVAARGADHNRSGAYEADFAGQTHRRQGDHRSAAAAIDAEDRAALIDSLILCKFLRGTIPNLYQTAAVMLSAVTGWTFQPDDLLSRARAIVDLRRAFNEREGATPAEDTLPPALLSDTDDPTDPTPRLSRDRLHSLLAAYYQQRGWTPDGWLPAHRRAELLAEIEEPPLRG
ncbi:MAG: aldehyde ferredoxin oxidoreductase [Isosphaeraceae bacterium]|nr:MAG: aldehyde ferredoxin oxidoreductase [Isosphaeraceae bacterium]